MIERTTTTNLANDERSASIRAHLRRAQSRANRHKRACVIRGILDARPEFRAVPEATTGDAAEIIVAPRTWAVDGERTVTLGAELEPKTIDDAVSALTGGDGPFPEPAPMTECPAVPLGALDDAALLAREREQADLADALTASLALQAQRVLADLEPLRAEIARRKLDPFAPFRDALVLAEDDDEGFGNCGVAIGAQLEAHKAEYLARTARLRKLEEILKLEAQRRMIARKALKIPHDRVAIEAITRESKYPDIFRDELRKTTNISEAEIRKAVYPYTPPAPATTDVLNLTAAKALVTQYGAPVATALAKAHVKDIVGATFTPMNEVKVVSGRRRKSRAGDVA